MSVSRPTAALLGVAALLASAGCAQLRAVVSRPPATHLPSELAEPVLLERELEVEATAYNSLRSQTDRRPRLAAWGDRLEPGMRVVAVSHDLIPLGLGEGARVRIDGVPGEWRVADRMPRRWKRAIDLYMGEDVRAARAFGRRSVTIRWLEEPALSAP